MADSGSPSWLSLMSMTPDTVVLQQLFSVLETTFSCKEGYVGILKLLLIGTTKAGIVFILQYLVKNPDKIITFLRLLALRLIYRKLQLKSVPDTKDYYMTKICQKEITTLIDSKDPNAKVLSLSGLPIYYTVQGNYSLVEYCPVLHSKFIDDIDKEAEKDLHNPQSMTTVCRDSNRKVFNPATMYPSINYKYLEKIVDGFFTVVKSTGMFKTQGILIDGEPGLGKSRSCDYLASLGKYGEVYYINLSLTTLLKKEFNTVVSEFLSRKSTVSTVFYFDELDKYLDYYIEFSFQQQDTDDFETYRRSKKQDFLYDLLELLETPIFEAGAVFIFCSNNFHTIFEDVDPVHFASLKSRFAPVRFVRCNKEEFIGYIEYFNAKMTGTDLYYPDLSHIFDRIRDDLSITYRAINHCHVNAGYDIEKLVDIVNNYKMESSPERRCEKTVKKLKEKVEPVDEKKTC